MWPRIIFTAFMSIAGFLEAVMFASLARMALFQEHDAFLAIMTGSLSLILLFLSLYIGPKVCIESLEEDE